MNTIDLDDDFAAAGKRPAVADLPQPWLMNGVYTVVFPCGTHKTIRVHTQQVGKLAGKRLLSLLIGPNNSHDYETFAELTPAGVWVWKNWKGKKPDHYANLLLTLAKGGIVDGHELLMSKTCFRCNRPLTDATSIGLGIGPECRRREGM